MQVMEEVYAVKVRARPDAARLYPSERRYSASTVGGLGAVHLALAVTCILLTALDMGQPLDAASKWTGRYGGGAWLGLAAALAGLTGILAWRRWYVDNNIRWFFICSCVSGVAALLCLAVTAAALATTHEDWSARRVDAVAALRNLDLSHEVHDALVPPSLSLHLADRQVSWPAENRRRHEDDAVQKRETERSSVVAVTVPSKASDEDLPWKMPAQGGFVVDGDDSHRFGSSPPRGEKQETHILHIPQHVAVPNSDQPLDISETVPEEHSPDFREDIVSSPRDPAGYLASVHAGEVPDPDGEAQGEITHHHVSSRQTISEDQFVDENDEMRIQGDSHSVFVDETRGRGSDRTGDNKAPEDGEDEGSKRETAGGEKIPKVIIEHHWFPEGREMRFVVAINILVASVLEVAWSLLSAKIAWKGMKNGYPDDSPRSDVRSVEEQMHSEETEKAKRAKKNSAKLGKPDIISNHDKGDTRRKVQAEGGRDPRLPLEESTMEYQERVRRFLASNNTNIETVGE